MVLQPLEIRSCLRALKSELHKDREMSQLLLLGTGLCLAGSHPQSCFFSEEIILLIFLTNFQQKDAKVSRHFIQTVLHFQVCYRYWKDEHGPGALDSSGREKMNNQRILVMEIGPAGPPQGFSHPQTHR